jgi:hypothetical protein
MILVSDPPEKLRELLVAFALGVIDVGVVGGPTFEGVEEDA